MNKKEKEDSLINDNRVNNFITNNHTYKTDESGTEYRETTPVKYRWSHGATDSHMGDGLIVYSLIQFLKCKVCVCLGSGGGYIPRIMTQARQDLHRQGIYDGDGSMEWGDIGTTILVDANNGVGGEPDYLKDDSFFREYFTPRIIIDTTENAFYNFIVKEDIWIDYLHIDADHSEHGVHKDFDLYSKRLSEHGIVSIHDTDPSYEQEYIKTKDIKETHWDSFSGPQSFVSEIRKSEKWEVFNLFNNGILKTQPSSTGLTLIHRSK